MATNRVIPMRYFLSLSLILLLGCQKPQVSVNLPGVELSPPFRELVFHPKDRPEGLVKDGILPNPALTGGAFYAGVTLADVRKPNFSATIRNVPESEKLAVLHNYHMDGVDRSKIEFDHCIPASLGGSNSPNNLWPESKVSEPLNAHVNDRLEDRVLRLVRDGKITLDEARLKFSGDWTAFYVEAVGPLPTDEGQ